jgi:hypothetical protein
MMSRGAFGIAWWRATLAAILLAVSATHAMPQVVAGVDSLWARAIDDYLAGSDASVPALLSLSPEEVEAQSRAALVAWIDTAVLAGSGPRADDAWRLAVRRVQAAALLPLEILSTLSTRPLRLPPRMKAYEIAALEAWRYLGEDELANPRRTADADARVRQRRFRAWWEIAHLQVLMNTGRFAEFRTRAQHVRLGDDDPRLHAEFRLLRGMVDETIARVPPVSGSEAFHLAPDTRRREIARGFGSARDWYRRALDATPGHTEATLHLGRVLLDLERPQESIATLRPLVANPCANTPCALASLFIGEAHEMRQALDEAAGAYAIASSWFEVRQSALIALMQVAARGGTAANGPPLLAQFGETMPLTRRDGPDAWSTYVSGRRQNIDALLGPLREAMSR